MFQADIAEIKRLTQAGLLNQAFNACKSLLYTYRRQLGPSTELIVEFANVLRAMGRNDEALAYLDVATELAEYAKNNEFWQRSLLARAQTLKKVGRYQESRNTFNLARTGWPSIPTSLKIQQMLLEVQLERAAGNSHKATETAWTARELAKLSNNTELQIEATCQLARLFSEAGMFDEALEESFKTIEVAEANGWLKPLVVAYTVVYVVYHSQRKYEQALPYAQQAYTIACQMKSSIEELFRGLNLVLALGDVGNNLAASKLLRQLKQHTKGADKLRLAMWQHTSAQISLQNNQLLSAQREALSAANLFLQYRSTKEELSARFIAAQAMYQQGNTKQCISSLLEIDRIMDSDEAPYQSLRCSVLELLADVYANQRLHAKEAAVLRTLMQLHAQIHSEEARRLAESFDLRYKLQATQRYADQLREENLTVKKTVSELRAELAAAALRLLESSGKGASKSVIDVEWGRFQEQFRSANEHLATKLTEVGSNLTTTEQRLCMMIAAGFTSAQCASVLNSSLRTIEWHRLQIRNKLGLEAGKNLQQFLQRMSAIA